MRRLLVLATILVVCFPAVANCGDNLYGEALLLLLQKGCECQQNYFEAEQQRLELQQFREEVLQEMRTRNDIQQGILWQMENNDSCQPYQLYSHPCPRHHSCFVPDPLLMPSISYSHPPFMSIMLDTESQPFDEILDWK